MPDSMNLVELAKKVALAKKEAWDRRAEKATNPALAGKDKWANHHGRAEKPDWTDLHRRFERIKRAVEKACVAYDKLAKRAEESKKAEWTALIEDAKSAERAVLSALKSAEVTKWDDQEARDKADDDEEWADYRIITQRLIFDMDEDERIGMDESTEKALRAALDEKEDGE